MHTSRVHIVAKSESVTNN